MNNAAQDDTCWSPNGTKIAFMSWRDGNQEIYVMNADGSRRDEAQRTSTGSDYYAGVIAGRQQDHVHKGRRTWRRHERGRLGQRD